MGTENGGAPNTRKANRVWSSPRETELSSILRKIREDRGLTQTDASSIIGVPRACYAAWEEGRSMPKVSAYRRVLAFMEMGGGDFVELMISVSEQMKKSKKA